MQQPAFEKASDHARTYIVNKHLPTALIAAVEGGEKVRILAWNEKGEEDPSLIEKRFALASISKAITGVGIACLVERGKLDYATPVCEIIREFGADEQRRRITAGHIFTHTTGFPSKSAAEAARTGCPPDLCRKWLLEDKLVCEPGTHMIYTTYTYQLFNWMIERLLGIGMWDFLDEHVFVPCGMTDTSFHHLPAARSVPTVDHPVKDPEDMERYCRLEMSGSGMWSTASDLMKLGRALLDPGKLMGVEAFERMTAVRSTAPGWATKEPTCRTWGWVREKQAAFPLRPESGFYHGGATGTLLWIDPARDLVFIFLSNRWGSGNDHAFATLNMLYESARA